MLSCLLDGNSSTNKQQIQLDLLQNLRELSPEQSAEVEENKKRRLI